MLPLSRIVRKSGSGFPVHTLRSSRMEHRMDPKIANPILGSML
jgi:hypothetical protein